MAFSKVIIVAGQSNAQRMLLGAPPANCSVSRIGIPSAALEADSGPWPKGWGSLDPNGWRNLAAQEVRAASMRQVTPAFVWWQGERSATAAYSGYGAGGIGLINDVDSRLGHTRSLWAVVRLHEDFVNDGGGGDPVTGTPLVRTGQQQMVDAFAARAGIVNVDDLALQANGHYLDADYLTAWGRCLALFASLSGDASWNP